MSVFTSHRQFRFAPLTRRIMTLPNRQHWIMARRIDDLRHFGDDRTPRSFGEPGKSWQLAKMGGHLKRHKSTNSSKKRSPRKWERIHPPLLASRLIEFYLPEA